jgi:hypothetical protein
MTLNNNVPFFVVHRGNQDYLNYCVRSIEKFHEVHLIGDRSNENFTKNWLDVSRLKSDYLDEFERSYKHLSTNSEFFEKVCFTRYIYMYEYASLHNIDAFIHCDSDIVLLEDCSDVLDVVTKFSAAFMVPENQSNNRMTASPHFSYWTVDGIRDFIEFFISCYDNDFSTLEDKYNYHKSNGILGGVCDMTLLYLFYKNRSDVLNLFKPLSLNGVIDFNASSVENTSELYHETLFTGKRVRSENGSLWVKYTTGYKRVYCLHMQGKAKILMKLAYQRNFYKLHIKLLILSVVRKLRQFYINLKLT